MMLLGEGDVAYVVKDCQESSKGPITTNETVPCEPSTSKISTTDSTLHSEPTTSEAVPNDVPTESATKNLNDIGLHTGKKIDNFSKCLLLENPWHPSGDYRYPCSTHSKAVSNEGNFRALLSFRIQAGYEILQDHLLSAYSHATYISKTTQNVLIHCCAEEISSVIVERIKNAKYWSIIFDETTDKAHIEQMTLIAKYFCMGGFLFFIDAFQSLWNENDATSSHVVEDSWYIWVCSYDLRNVVLRQKFFKLLRIPSMYRDTNAVNNSISKSSKFRSVRNATAIMEEIIAFFSQSAKRNSNLKANVGSQLVRLCETRWVERHDAVILFFNALPKIVEALAEIGEWSESESAKKKDSLATLHTLRQDSEKSFSVLHKDATCAATQQGDDLIMPRLAARQMHRAYYDANSTEEYHRKSIYIPFPLLQDGIQFRGRTAATVLDGEMCIWKENWKRESKESHSLPETVLDVIDSCEIDLLPSIRCLLEILLTLPVSVESAESSFSSLQLVK
ncbi:hypothetical protein PR048_009330 [Dryococelus australis]|uniref:DUF4371 domain-containing protein n=1 Tax=Dryococelus australis TaxID=614101 RepID=A0ABQ9HZK7_9NEOP|nr:hypothetical protein PR048_009330 [Dryococelus australis]